jgi:hypothetical protein
MSLMRILPIWKLVIFAAAAVLSARTIAFSQSWRQIVPLHTTRSQVEKHLGKPTIIGSVPTYYFANERVEVFFAQYPCGHPLNLGKWNVRPGTVLSINIIPKEKLRLADMQLDLSKFRKERIPFDFPYEYSHLVNDEEGLTLSLVSFGKDFVDSYSYEPKSGDRHLHCPDYSDNEERRTQNCVPLAFRIQCSSEEIRMGQPVECTFESASSPKEQIGLKWHVSAGASQTSESDYAVKVVLIDPTKREITLTVNVVSPTICFDTASTKLRVTKMKKCSRPKRT